MDKRIIKTKNNLKSTLITMLKEKPFEQITVKELCDRAQTSRITFYTHYSDKCELVSDIFADMRSRATAEYHRLQLENNADGDIVGEYLNVLDGILNTYYENYDFFMHTHTDISPMLGHMYYREIEVGMQEKIQKDLERLNPIYPINLISSFVCSGLRGFINEARRSSYTMAEIRTMARDMLKNLLTNDVVRKS